MKQQLNISVFGLKLTTIDEIKRIIKDLLPEQYQVNWTHLNDSNLQVLLINDVFFDLPNITEIRKNNHLKTLRIATDPQIQGQLLQNILYLPIQRNTLQLWLEQYVFGSSITTEPTTSNYQTEVKPAETETYFAANLATAHVQKTHIPKIEPLAQLENKKDYFRKTSKPLLPSGPTIEEVFQKPESPLTNALFKNLLPYQNFEYLAEQLWNSQQYRQCVLSIAQHKIAFINKATNQFWLIQKLPTIEADKIEIQHADLNTVVRFCHKNQAYDLQNGLWDFVWQNLAHQTPSYNAYYRLRYWPQPLNQSDRKDIFKLAAYFQQGAHIQYVHQQTNISLEFIYRFIFTGLVNNSIYEISENEADIRFRSSIQQELQTSEPETKSALRGFFSKLRKKLGL